MTSGVLKTAVVPAALAVAAAALGSLPALVAHFRSAAECWYPISAVCIGNLRGLDAAKLRWELEQHKTTNDKPVMADLTAFISEIPRCPDGGRYLLGRVGDIPTCSIKGHQVQ